MKLLTKLWSLLKTILKRKDDSPFALTEKVTAKVSPVELSTYRLDADRNGVNLNEWVRTSLNKGVSKSTITHLSKGRGRLGDAIGQAFEELDESDYRIEGARTVIPLRREPMSKKISGHPCHNLDANIPRNFTATECQGVCTSEQPGWAGRPCFWGPQVARQCMAFEPKRVMPVKLPTKR